MRRLNNEPGSEDPEATKAREEFDRAQDLKRELNILLNGRSTTELGGINIERFEQFKTLSDHANDSKYEELSEEDTQATYDALMKETFSQTELNNAIDAMEELSEGNDDDSQDRMMRWVLREIIDNMRFYTWSISSYERYGCKDPEDKSRAQAKLASLQEHGILALKSLRESTK